MFNRIEARGCFSRHAHALTDEVPWQLCCTDQGHSYFKSPISFGWRPSMPCSGPRSITQRWRGSLAELVKPLISQWRGLLLQHAISQQPSQEVRCIRSRCRTMARTQWQSFNRKLISHICISKTAAGPAAFLTDNQILDSPMCNIHMQM